MALFLFVVAVLTLPIVVVALVANRAQRRAAARREAERPATPRDDGGAPERARAGLVGQTEGRLTDSMSSREAGERSRRTHHTDGATSPAALDPASLVARLGPRPPMLRTTSPVRLALVRASLVALVLAFPALFLATGRHGVGAGHVAWSVLAAYAGGGVALASWLERRALRRGGPARAALLVWVAGTVAVVVGASQALYVSHVLQGGGAGALEGLQRAIDRATAAPDAAVVGAVLACSLVGSVWGLPLATVTRERLLPPVPGWSIGAVAALAVTIPAYVLLTILYEGADAIDGWIGGGEAPRDQ